MNRNKISFDQNQFAVYHTRRIASYHCHGTGVVMFSWYRDQLCCNDDNSKKLGKSNPILMTNRITFQYEHIHTHMQSHPASALSVVSELVTCSS